MRADHRGNTTAALVIAPADYLSSHVEACKLFDGRKAKRLRDLVSEQTVPKPDDPSTVRVVAELVELLADGPCRVQVRSMRTVGNSWVTFDVPKELIYKCERGFIDVYVRAHAPAHPDHEVLVERLRDRLPTGFLLTVDTKANSVLRYRLPAGFSPPLAVDDAGRLTCIDTLTEAAAACEAITRWLDQPSNQALLRRRAGSSPADRRAA